MGEAVENFLDALYASLGEFPLNGPDLLPLDERVVESLHRLKQPRDYFLEIVNLVSGKETSAEIHRDIRGFLGRALAYKHAPREVIHYNHLWCDHYRFLLRELFLGVIALLIAHRQYAEVNSYLDTEYLFETDRGPQSASFLCFNAYIKTLDEFRMRRLRQSRFSAAADFLRERSDLVFLPFDDIMQADFLLSLRGLLHHPRSLTPWFPRTLVFAKQYSTRGFDLFAAAQSRKNFKAVCEVLDVRDKDELQERFAKVAHEGMLSTWKLGGEPVPFERYMGLEALATV